jgi:hypothetical protein
MYGVLFEARTGFLNIRNSKFRCLFEATPYYHNVFTFTLFLPEGRAGNLLTKRFCFFPSENKMSLTSTLDFLFESPLHLEPGSSVSIVSGYGLDDRAIEVRSPAGAKNFSCSLCVQTGSGAHPASCTMGAGGPFPGAKARPRRDADHSPLSSAKVENK